MKPINFSLSLALAASFALPISALIAQPGDPGELPRMAAERIEKMKENLDLTEDQEKQIKDLFRAMGEEMQALRKDESVSDADRREKGKSLMGEMREKIDAVLTPEQRAKRDESAPKRGPKSKGEKPAKENADKAETSGTPEES